MSTDRVLTQCRLQDFLRYMQTESSQQLQHLQEQVCAGALVFELRLNSFLQLYLNILTPDDASRISTYFYDRPEASRRRNKHIYPSNKPGSLRVFSMTDLLAHSNYPYSADSFVYPRRSLSLRFMVEDSSFVCQRFLKIPRTNRRCS